MDNIKTVLIVEDEISIMKAILNKFKSEPFRTLEARNGEEGLEIALKEHPDLILLDVIMPKMDGITMLKKLRSGGDSWGREAKVMMLTNLTDTKKLEEAKALGADSYFIKTDLKIEDVLKTVIEKLNNI